MHCSVLQFARFGFMSAVPCLSPPVLLFCTLRSCSIVLTHAPSVTIIVLIHAFSCILIGVDYPHLTGSRESGHTRSI